MSCTVFESFFCSRQMIKEKKDSKNGVAQQTFGPSYIFRTLEVLNCIRSLSWSATTLDTLTWKSETRTKIFTCRVGLGVQKCYLGWQCYSFHFGWFFSFLDNKLEPYDYGGIFKFFHETELFWYLDNLQFFWLLDKMFHIQQSSFYTFFLSTLLRYLAARPLSGVIQNYVGIFLFLFMTTYPPLLTWVFFAMNVDRNGNFSTHTHLTSST